MIKKRPSHGKIVILTEVYFSANHEQHLLTFLVYKMEYARRNGRSDNSRNLGGTLHITGLAHQNVSPVCGVLRLSSDRG